MGLSEKIIGILVAPVALLVWAILVQTEYEGFITSITGNTSVGPIEQYGGFLIPITVSAIVTWMIVRSVRGRVI